MNHLITYQLFESTKPITAGEVKQTCEDILLDLEDDGFNTTVVVNTWGDDLNPMDVINWVVIRLRKKTNSKKMILKISRIDWVDTYLV